jgi:gliding motility-associated lipoprotein GldH
MAMSNRHQLLLSFLLLTVLLLTGCKQSTVYYHFENTPENGWEKTDPVIFDVNKMTADAICQEELALRISNKYPFMRLTLIVEQTIFPSGETMIDTLDCNLIDERGNAQGNGVSQYQYMFPLKLLQLHSGDSLQFSVHHDMKREILPGITSVGIKIKEK